jgi:hypothetical protein
MAARTLGIGIALWAGCATPGEPSPPAVDTPTPVETAQPDLDEPSAAPIGPLRLTVAQTRRALNTLAGVSFTDALPWPTDATRRGLAGQQEVAAIGQDLVDAVVNASAAGSSAWRTRVEGGVVAHIEVESLSPPHGCALPGVSRPGEIFWLDWGRSPITTAVTAPADGRYLVRLRAIHRPSQAGFGGATVAIDVDGATTWGWDLVGRDDPGVVEVAVDLTAGPHTLALRLPEGLDAAAEASQYVVHSYCVEGNAVGYDWIEVLGPLDTGAVPCRPTPPMPPIAGLSTPPPGPSVEQCAAQALVPLAQRAWRRPPDTDAQGRLIDVVLRAWEDGEPWEAALAEGWRAIVTSPRFLTRVVPGTPEARPLDAWERAERLALTVWGDLPDPTLLACAASGELAGSDGPCGWHAQVERVLDDPRAAALTDDFFIGWLGLDQLDASDLPPGAPAETLDALRSHALAALRDAQRSDQPATSLLVAPLAPLAPAVAAWLGDSAPRAGWLTAPAVLASLSEPWRSSPVRRGVYVLDRLRCDAPPAPPADVPALTAQPGDAPTSVLDALAAHRADPACAACHDAIDPVGVALEAWGPGGVARPTAPSPLSALDGTPLPDAAALASWLAQSSEVDLCFTARFAGYALGREVRLDDPALAAWGPSTRQQPWRARMVSVLQSGAFLSWATADEVAP